jgi:ABC-type Mn2+/Zn2+ transport system ATPase subunit
MDDDMVINTNQSDRLTPASARSAEAALGPPASPEALLRLEEVTVGYGAHPVLSGLNLRLPRGSFTGLLGTNGSGKSTLIKTILGIIPPLAGRLLFDPAAGRLPALGYVPQRESLDPIFLLSCFEVVLMGACARIKPGRFINRTERERAHRCLQEAGMDHVSRKRFSELSGGQRQRVLIARALATQPDFLLLDEPTAGVDVAATQAIMEILRHLHEEHHLTILMVNHDLHTVRASAQEVIWLHHGKVWHGPVATMLSREKIEDIMELELH